MTVQRLGGGVEGLGGGLKKTIDRATVKAGGQEVEMGCMHNSTQHSCSADKDRACFRAMSSQSGHGGHFLVLLRINMGRKGRYLCVILNNVSLDEKSKMNELKNCLFSMSVFFK